jgi:undecaprenyl-diphosphatase
VSGGLFEAILHLRGWAALAVVFAVPALESSAFLGFLFPGETAVLLGGVLAYQGRISLTGVIAAAVAGAVIGDTVGYEVGRRHGLAILARTVGRVVRREHLDRASHYLATRGGKAVFLGRFTAALRVLIPGMAGMSGMPYRTFAAWNVTGGALWATGFVLLGYLAGSSYRHVESVAKKASVLLLLLVVVVGATVWVARWIARHPERLLALADRVANRPRVAAVRARYRRQLQFLVRRLEPRGALGLSLTGSLVLIALAGWAFGVVVQDVLSGESLNPFDHPVLDLFVRHREPWLTRVAEVVTYLGSSAVLVPLLAAVALAYRWRCRTWRPAALSAAGFGGAVVLYSVLKLAVRRPRPAADLLGHHYNDFSFPSGHATQAVVAWGLLGALAAGASSSWRRKVAAWTGVVLVAIVVDASRVYLGAHWPTDVIGGSALGALWLSALLTLVRAVPALRPGNQPKSHPDGPPVPARGEGERPRSRRRP